MNRTSNPDFFKCWDTSKELLTTDLRSLSCKDRIEHDIAIEHFMDCYGFYPTEDYQEAIHNWLESNEIPFN